MLSEPMKMRVYRYLQKNPGPQQVSAIGKACNITNNRAICDACSIPDIVRTDPKNKNATLGAIELEWTGYAPYRICDQYAQWCKENNLKSYGENEAAIGIARRVLNTCKPDEIANNPVEETLEKTLRTIDRYSSDYPGVAKRVIGHLKEYLQGAAA